MLIKLRSQRRDAHVEFLEGKYLSDLHFDRVLSGEDTEVLKPDGSPLLVYRPRVLPASACELAYPYLLKITKTASNRRKALTGPDDDGGDAIAGYFERTVHFPYCRACKFTLDYPEEWAKCLPLIRAMDRIYKNELPEKYAAQIAAVNRTPTEYIIPGTAFTTITVNRTIQFAAHPDSNNLKEGFGVIGVIRAGEYSGGLLVFPRYDLAVDMGSQDLLLFDSQELHGNTKLVGDGGTFERLSLVCYFRELMTRCLPLPQELRRYQRRKPGDPLWD